MQFVIRWLAQGATPAEAMLTIILFLLVFLVKSIVSTQKEITQTLHNHLETISGHMATQNEILRALSGKVLDAALRAPDTSAIHIPVEAVEPAKKP